jgi:hypothetical protein
MRTAERALVLALAALGAALGAPRSAAACGGTFCDSGPRAMAVDQKGENILFVVAGGKVEAHIQIQYKGDAARFAWVLPVPALPEVEVGSQALFQNLLSGTVPRYGLNAITDSCPNAVLAPSLPPTRANGSATIAAIDGGGGGTMVVLQKAVGSFEVTVLQGGTAQEITDWLTSNGYAMPPETPQLLQSYVAKSFLFVAVKLTGGAGIDEIHPLVVRYPGTEPCVPLELTKVAAVEDMGVRTFFLGSDRIVPKNYKHVALNPLMINWLNLATNYDEVISHAVDNPVADGHAFVTEYAGPSNVVSNGGLVSQQWSGQPFVGADVMSVIDLLKAQGFISFCGGAQCTFTHPLILPLLRTYVPAPAGVDEGAFYECMKCYASKVDKTAWGDGTGFAVALEERVIVPGRRAADLLMAHPYLTRMFTTISPAEMTVDPTFEARTGLPDVGFSQTGTQRTRCDNKSGVILPDAREVGLAPVNNPASPSAMRVMWPTFTAEMPWAERVEDLTSASAAGAQVSTDGGAPIVVLVDNKDKIDALLKAWNDSVGWVPQGLDAGGVGAIASLRDAQADGDSSTDLSVNGGGACACDVPGRAARGGYWTGLSLAMGMLIGRRRRRGLVPR